MIAREMWHFFSIWIGVKIEVWGGGGVRVCPTQPVVLSARKVLFTHHFLLWGRIVLLGSNYVIMEMYNLFLVICTVLVIFISTPDFSNRFKTNKNILIQFSPYCLKIVLATLLKKSSVNLQKNAGSRVSSTFAVFSQFSC